MAKDYSPILKKINSRIGIAVLFIVFFLLVNFSVNAQADLSITKTVVGNNLNPKVGDEITFEITVTNKGPEVATGVTIEDEVLSGYTDIINVSNGITPTDGIVKWEGLTIPVTAADGSNAIVLTLTVTVVRDGEYANRVQITASDQADPNSVPYDPNRVPAEGFDEDDLNDGIVDDDEATVLVEPEEADLSITKEVVSGPDADGLVTFAITVRNQGPRIATGVTVSDVMPSGYSNIVNVSNGGSSTTGEVLWEGLTVPVTANDDSNALVLTLTANLLDTGDYDNRAQITASDQLDPDSSPDSSFDDDDLDDNLPDDDESDAVIPGLADLAITKEIDFLDSNLIGGRPHQGTRVIFNITLTNNGPTATQNVTVLDALPQGYIYVSDDSGGNYDETTGVWTIGNLDNEEVATLAITCVIGLEDDYVNTASITNSDVFDANTSNNTASVSADPLEIFIPQAFSPNNDGINDTFEMPGLGFLYPNFKIEIFNRWGNKVYDYANNNSTSPTWWNGYSNGSLTFNGKKQLPTGTYYYILYFNKDNLDPISNWVYLNR